MAEHTPGPWTIEEYGDYDAPNLVIHKDSETRVCFMAMPGSHGDPAQIEADARLIRAAPTLLATAKAFEAGLSEYCDGPERDALRAAIAEAEGRNGRPPVD